MVLSTPSQSKTMANRYILTILFTGTFEQTYIVFKTMLDSIDIIL
nr:MAG TPA: hypothetical protein [Bacteriophage sp.]